MIGQVLNGKFRIVSAIGQGGMGAVYRAEQMPLGRPVALKVLKNRPGMNDLDPAFQRRFFLEASLCAKLSHPNIVTVYDYGKVEGTADESYFMAMEFLEGETLHRKLRAHGGPLPTADAVRICLEIARGLREAHRNGIVHRDLKPGNVMLVPDEESGEKVKIVDFGLVKQVDGADREDLTREGSFLGSPRYMSPEQIEHSNIDHRTDLYSLGVMLYQSLCGKVPFDGDTSMQILLAHVSHPVPAMRDKNPAIAVPPQLEAVARKLLEKNPAARFQTAEELVRELRGLQKILGLEAVRGEGSTSHGSVASVLDASGDPSGSLVGASLPGNTSTAGTPSEVKGRKMVPIAAAAGLALIALAGLGVVLFGSKPTQPAAAVNAAGANPAPHGSTPPPAEQTAHTLRIESTPAGATVTENGTVLGTTPVVVMLPGSGNAPRDFVVSSPGFAPYTVHQQLPVQANVQVLAPLVPLPATPTAGNVANTNAGNANPAPERGGGRRGGRASRGGGGGGGGGGGNAHPPPSNPPPSLGIRFER